jgi:excisionase family DNA binding protein
MAARKGALRVVSAGTREAEGRERRRQSAAEELERAADGVSDREGMNAEEVAAFLGVDRKTVYEYANRGKIPHQRLGKRLLFSRQALVAWLGACKVASSRHRER